MIRKTLNCLYHAKIHIKLDTIIAFNQLYIQDGDKILTTFWTSFNLFKDVIMLFRFCNDPVLSQYYINDILRKYLDIFYIAYFNNILIYSKDKLKHKVHIKKVLN